MNNNKKVNIGLLVIAIPFIMGIIFWDKLPDNLIYNLQIGKQFTSKNFVVFVYPALIALAHLIINYKPQWLNIKNNKYSYIIAPFIALLITIQNIILVLNT